MTWLLLLALAALALFGAWRWLLANGSAALLDRGDALLRGRRRIRRLASAHYGDDPAQRVELWCPAQPPATLVIFLHGGGWDSGAPEHYRFVARTLGAMGHAVALAGYRLGPEGRFPAMLEDSAAAVAWVARNAAAQGLGNARLVLMGHSAGAYNAAMLALDPRWLVEAGAAPGQLAGIIAMSGPYDFHPFTNPSAIAALGHVEPPEATQPIAFANGAAPPLLLVHGTADTLVRPRNARVLHAAVRAKGGVSALVELDGRGHAWPVMALARPFARDRRVRQAIHAFVEALERRPASVAVQGELG